MSKGKYRQRLTEMGWWGVFFILVMPAFSAFFYKLHLRYAEDFVRFAGQDMADLARTSQGFSNIFGVAALLFLIFPICGGIMVFLGREFYQDELKFL
ncbi:hypothetical protein GL279_05220 [Paracoccus limosus]|uniref:Uncharacterized protein n=1 Tax=Paracoccus limosus TaxID=913252 RepID=A0A844H676_9RHOB|nr:hypothetical protein [Paracoccus limosus]MTH33997.1 hypothetical protein [Paracoccus limosus]